LLGVDLRLWRCGDGDLVTELRIDGRHRRPTEGEVELARQGVWPTRVTAVTSLSFSSATVLGSRYSPKAPAVAALAGSMVIVYCVVRAPSTVAPGAELNFVA
jgi:hypothetical protein